MKKKRVRPLQITKGDTEYCLFIQLIDFMLHFLQEHFIDLATLSRQSGVSVDHILHLQTSKCMPKPAFKVEGQLSVGSYFGLESHSQYSDFYAIATVNWLKQITSIPELNAQAAFNLFKEHYLSHVTRMLALDEAISECINEQDEEALFSTWRGFLSGKYAAITHRGMVKEIAAFDVFTQVLKHITQDFCKDALSSNERALARLAIKQLSQVLLTVPLKEKQLLPEHAWVHQVVSQYDLSDAG